MSTTNGFHPPLTSTAVNGSLFFFFNQTKKKNNVVVVVFFDFLEPAKRLPSTSSTSSTSSNSTTATNTRLKSKTIVSTIPEIRRRKKKHHNQKKKRLNQNDKNNNNPTKKSQNFHQHHPTILHQKKSANQTENLPTVINNNNNHHHHHHHVINNDHCDSCGEFYGEMISCDTCPATFHLLCANPPLSREDVPKGSYFCENCRAKSAEEKGKPCSFDPKSNGIKKPTTNQLTHIKIPTASNGRSLVQPSGEIKFRATNHTMKSNLKRKRIESASTHANVSTVKPPAMKIDTLKKLLLSCRPEEFRGPPLPFEETTFNRENFFQKNSLNWQKFCFICRKSSRNSSHPSIHCDYCPLTYHLDCLNPPLTSLPSTTDKWMCPNHIEPILDRYLFSKKQYSTSERVKIYRQYSQIEPNTIIQDFTHMRQMKSYLLTKQIHQQQRLERIEISQIPKSIEQFYQNANSTHQSRQIDTCVSDVLQSIVDRLSNENDEQCQTTSINILDRIDCLLDKLNEPNYTNENNQTINDPFSVLVAAADQCLNDDEHNSILPTNSLSLLIDLSQFRLSHAALIHKRSKHVIYIRKHVIWFGSSKNVDVCLRNFNADQTCRYVSEKHACLYYDRKRNAFELLNYSEFGTIVNGLRYGLGNLTDDEDDDDEEEICVENENLQKCFCLSTPLYHSAWDGAAQLEQGTVVQIGCHEFLFYRHVVR